MINAKNWFQLQPMYAYIRKQAETQQFFKYLEIGGTFALVTIFLFFAIMPTMTTIFSLLGEIKSKEVFIGKVDNKIKNIIKAQGIYTQVQEKYSLVEDSFPSQPQYYNGATNLATLFRDSSLDINQLNLGLSNSDKKDNQFFNSYQVNITGEGEYLAVLELVKKIFNNRRLVNVSNIQIIRPEDKDEIKTNSVKISVNNDLYFLPDN